VRSLGKLLSFSREVLDSCTSLQHL
jgi:hypothetical protein